MTVFTFVNSWFVCLFFTLPFFTRPEQPGEGEHYRAAPKPMNLQRFALANTLASAAVTGTLYWLVSSGRFHLGT